MPRYVDGFVVPVPKKNMAAYTRIARKAAKIWMELGALEYRECLADDIKPKGMPPFTAQFKIKPNETIMFSWIVYRSRKHRDAVNAKIMKDPRIAKIMAEGPVPFDCARMAYGGFKTIVEA